VEKRQVFDLPDVAIVVTEHQAETRVCSCCGHKTKGKFPEGVRGPVQYGERVQALAAYFEHQHLIPFERIAQLFEDLYGITLSPGTCSNMDKRLSKNLEVFEANLKAHLLACKILHFDETGVRCEKKLNWIHVVASTSATLYNLHKKRGCEAINEHDILPRYSGIAVHDHWHPYFTYEQVTHILCNVHHLRELKYVHEQEKAHWAEEMNQLLLKGKKMTEVARGEGRGALCPQMLRCIEEEYATLILKVGRSYMDAGDAESTNGDEVSKAGLNLFRRLLHKMDCVLGFLKDLTIPFSNNLAEQDLRMEKVKQKISGCFRTFTGGQISCRVRSYISTARKQGWRIIDALAEAIRGSPRFLPLHNF
jgi:transposase